MRKKSIFKIIFTILVAIVIQAVSSSVIATTEDYTVLKKTDDEYIIYLKESLDKEFEFSYTNQSLENDESLDYIKSAKDSKNGDAIAYIDANLYEKYFKNSETTYLWAKSGENYLAKGMKIDLSDNITEDMVSFVKNTTKRIAVNTDSKDVVEDEKDGIKYTTTTGKIEIKDDEKSNYSYVMIDAKNSEKYTKLIELIEKINKTNSEDNITNLDNSKQFYNLYTELLNGIDNNAWKKVENMQIPQPKESKTGDKYIVWLKKDNGNNSVYDVQIMTCYQNEDKQYIKENQVIKTTSKLPITYDSIALFVVLGIAVVLFIVILIVRNKNKKDTNN